MKRYRIVTYKPDEARREDLVDLIASMNPRFSPLHVVMGGSRPKDYRQREGIAQRRVRARLKRILGSAASAKRMHLSTGSDRAGTFVDVYIKIAGGRLWNIDMLPRQMWDLPTTQVRFIHAGRVIAEHKATKVWRHGLPPKKAIYHAWVEDVRRKAL